MEKLTDFAPFQWILEETERVNFEKWKGSRILNFTPHRFSHYCKIMHPFYFDNEITDKNLLWSQCDPEENLEFEYAERKSFKELARQFNLEYTKEFSCHTITHIHGNQTPRYMLYPYEGTMERETVEEIIPVLQPFTPSKCYFQYDLTATTFYNEDHGNGYLYYGELQEVLQLFKSREHVGSPTYWWDEDKSWCLYTDPDMNFSIFGGTKEMIEKLQGNDSLECINVDRNTRVDYKADMKNHPTIEDF